MCVVPSDATATELQMPGVKADILAKVVEYMNHHKGVEPPIIEKPLRSKVTQQRKATAKQQQQQQQQHSNTTRGIKRGNIVSSCTSCTALYMHAHLLCLLCVGVA